MNDPLQIQTLKEEIPCGWSPYNKRAHHGNERCYKHSETPENSRGYPKRGEENAADYSLRGRNGHTAIHRRHDNIFRLLQKPFLLFLGKGHKIADLFDKFRPISKKKER